MRLLLEKHQQGTCADEQAVGSPGDLSAFDVHAAGFRTHAEQIGLDVDSMFFGIDEGRILGGPDGGNVNSHAIGRTKKSAECSCCGVRTGHPVGLFVPG